MAKQDIEILEQLRQLRDENSKLNRALEERDDRIGQKDAALEQVRGEKQSIESALRQVNGQLDGQRDELDQLRALRDEDPAMKIERAEAARQAAQQQKDDEDAEREAKAKKKPQRQQFIVAGITAVVAGSYFLFTYLWVGWNHATEVIVGSIAGLAILAGFLPQIIKLIDAVLPQMASRANLVSAFVSFVVGLTVAILGVKGEGWVWFVMFFTTMLGYGFLSYFEIWAMRVGVQGSNARRLAGLIAILVPPSILFAFFFHPVTDIFGQSEFIEWHSGPFQGPVEHLVNTAICLIGLLALFGIGMGVAWALGIKIFVSWRTLVRKEIARMKHADVADYLEGALKIIASILVGALVVVGLWPIDDSDTVMKVVAPISGLLSAVGFWFVKSKLLKAGKTPGAAWGRIFFISLIVVAVTGYVSLGTFYKASSEEERISQLVTDITGQAAAFYNLVASDALAFADEAETDEEAAKYTDAVEEMKAAQIAIEEATSYAQVRASVRAFREAGSQVTLVHEQAPQVLDSVRVPPEPSSNALLAHVLGLTEAPEGVAKRYVGSLIKALAAWVLAEALVLLIFFIRLFGRGREEDGVEAHGHVIGAMDADGRDFLVALSGVAFEGTNPGDSFNVLNGDGQAIEALTAKKALSDGAFVMQRQNSDRELPRGAKVVAL